MRCRIHPCKTWSCVARTCSTNLRIRAISAGAVMFGGLTYIGNAPNLMLRAVASRRGVGMPAFVPFMLLAAAVTLPGLPRAGAFVALPVAGMTADR